MTKEIWEHRYQAKQTGWDRGEISPALLRWLESGLLARCSILVPGCGQGHEVVALAARGFEVTALDIAPTPITRLQKQLKERDLQATVIQTDILQWAPQQPFDAIYEQTCLCALEPATWKAYAERLHRWLKPGGRLFALFMQTHREGGPPYHCDLSVMSSLFPAEQWHWQSREAMDVAHPSGINELGYVLEKL